MKHYRRPAETDLGWHVLTQTKKTVLDHDGWIFRYSPELEKSCLWMHKALRPYLAAVPPCCELGALIGALP